MFGFNTRAEREHVLNVAAETILPTMDRAVIFLNVKSVGNWGTSNENYKPRLCVVHARSDTILKHASKASKVKK